MSWQNLIIIFISGLNVGLAFLVWLRNTKSKINIFFALASLSLGIWSLFVVLFKMAGNDEDVATFIQAANFFGILLTMFFFIFTLFFPFQVKKLFSPGKIFVFIFNIIVLALIIIDIFSTEYNAVKVVILSPNNNLSFMNNYFWTIYAVCFIFTMAWSFFNLLKKFRAADGFAKKQLGLIIVGAGIAAGCGIIFDIILPFWDGFRLMTVGTFSTLSIIIFVNYLVFLHDYRIIDY